MGEVICISQHAAIPNGIPSPYPAGLLGTEGKKRVLGVYDETGAVTSDGMAK